MKKTYEQTIKERLLDFQKEIKTVCKKCGRRAEDIKVVYATKYLTADQLVDFLNIGRQMGISPITIGENRVQEAGGKMALVRESYPYLLDTFKLVMIGNLQKNKINKAIRIFSEIQAVDSLELAEAINKRITTFNQTGPAARHSIGAPVNQLGCAPIEHLARVTHFPVMPIFLEVNISGEERKHGFGVEEIERAIAEIRQMRVIKVKGLMTMASYFDDPEKARPIFKTLRQIADHYNLNNLKTSMGMSSDWKVAVEEGSDMIRIGRRIFMGLPEVQSYFTPGV